MNLADHPNELVATTNDKKAKALLKKLGVLEKLNDMAAGKRKLPSRITRLDLWQHPTHWITALHYIGFERAEENGFAVRCQPKSMVTREMFKSQLEAEAKEEFPQGYTRIDYDLP